MNKKFMIEQCRRLKVIHQEESDEIEEKEEKEVNSRWLIIHNEGHKKLVDDFIEFLNNAENRNKRIAKKWLKKRMKKSDSIIKKLDKKYNKFANNEVMNQEDERIYNMNDGAICIAYTLINIMNKRRYISKLQ